MVAVGSVEPNNLRGEKFEDGNWSDIEPPPVPISYGMYAVVFHVGNFYYFGGTTLSGPVDDILGLNEASWTWSKLGKLNSLRYGHSAILVENTFMVIGGQSRITRSNFRVKSNEACRLTDNKFSCTEASSKLTKYVFRPLCFLVNDDYGEC